MKKAVAVFLLLAVAIVTACSSSSSTGDAGPPQECVDAPGTCNCGPTVTGSTTTPCSSASVGGTALCCGDEAYFSSHDGVCSCTTFTCAQTADDCECLPGASGTGGTIVTTCSPVGAGNVCCLDSTGDRCFCNVSATACQDGQNTVVDTCSVNQLVLTCDTFFVGQPHPYKDCRTGM